MKVCLSKTNFSPEIRNRTKCITAAAYPNLCRPNITCFDGQREKEFAQGKLGSVQALSLPAHFDMSVGFYSNAFAKGRCLVADPTGTPLNVRTEPNGRIVDSLRNGVLVEIIELGSSHGKARAYVGRADSKLPLGWVFRDYLNCDQHEQNVSIPSGNENGSVLAQSRCLVADPTRTPLNVRTEPNGRHVGQWGSC